MDPCGTPQVNKQESDMVPLILVTWVLSDRYDSNQATELLDTSYVNAIYATAGNY